MRLGSDCYCCFSTHPSSTRHPTGLDSCFTLLRQEALGAPFHRGQYTFDKIFGIRAK